MMTIVTMITIEPGKEPQWDAVFQKRIAAAKEQPGWIGVQVGIPTDRINQRVIIGTWESRAAWESWHAADVFQQTRAQMDGLETDGRQEWWHEIIVEEHR